MGLFIDQQYNKQTLTNSSSTLVNGYNNQYGSYDFGQMLMQLPSLFMLGVEQFGNDDSSEGSGDGKNEAKVNAKTQELEAVYAEASKGYTDKITSIEQIDAKINDLYNENSTNYLNANVQAKATSLSNLNESVSGEKSSTSIGNNLKQYYSDFPECKNVKEEYIDPQTKQPNLPPDVESLKTSYQNAINIEQVQIPNAKNELSEAKQAELARLTALKGQAENIQDQINKLKHNTDIDGKKYNVKKEADDIKSFMTALKAFQNAKEPSEKQYAAAALKAAYESNGTDSESGIQQKSVTAAWRLVEKQVNEVLNK